MQVRAELEAKAQRQMNQALDVAIRTVIMETSSADVDTIAKNVSWAKFGEKSLAEFSWNLVKEEVWTHMGVKCCCQSAVVAVHAHACNIYPCATMIQALAVA